ncbi:MAG: T9SS type A sorting domain-containing protein [Bacteroidales bacterium]|nr:T9SS type A sorting domain-containing protein [Bacteroidales bacterium]MDD3861025.1 T9SS type A sorting domain-containing protein [Bacteroidales bacterium]
MLFRKRFYFILFALNIATNCTNISAQTIWTKYPNNPVKEWSAQASCIIEEGTIKMWYASGHLGISRIKAAWSNDGLSWNDYNEGDPVLALGELTEWDNTWQDTPEILKIEDTYYLFYYGDSTTRLLYSIGTYDSITCAIGLAKSNDAENWSKSAFNPVFTKGDSIVFDGRWIESPTVIFDENKSQFYLWYSGMPCSLICKTGLAISTDAEIWLKHPNNPVVSVGPYFYDFVGVYTPCVIKSDDIFEMWYSSMPPVEESWDSLTIAYAVSLDGINWIKYPSNPVYDRFYPPFNIESDAVSTWAPEVLYIADSNKYLMYYDGSNGINLAIADRDVLFSENCNISISENLTINYGEQTQLLASGGNLYHWIPDTGLDNAFVSNPIASPEETTTYTVLIVSETCITKEEVTVTVFDNSQINENFVDFQLKVFPNPAKPNSEIFANYNFRNANITVSNVLGQVVYTGKIINNNKILDYVDLSIGIYNIKIIEDKNVSNAKIIVR